MSKNKATYGTYACAYDTDIEAKVAELEGLELDVDAASRAAGNGTFDAGIYIDAYNSDDVCSEKKLMENIVLCMCAFTAGHVGISFFLGLEAKVIKILTLPNSFIEMSKLQVAPSREPLIRGVS